MRFPFATMRALPNSFAVLPEMGEHPFGGADQIRSPRVMGGEGNDEGGGVGQCHPLHDRCPATDRQTL